MTDTNEPEVLHIDLTAPSQRSSIVADVDSLTPSGRVRASTLTVKVPTDDERPLGTLEKLHHRFSNELFGNYGAFSADKPWTVFFIGVVLAIVSCCGVLVAEEENDFDFLWTEKDTRLLPEQSFFREHFGGLPRKQAFIISPKSGSSVLSAEHILTLRDALLPMLNSDDSRPDTLKMTDSEGTVWTPTDFCEAPSVPTLFRPYLPKSLSGDGDGQATLSKFPGTTIAAQSQVSYAYTALSQCLKTRGAVTYPSTPVAVDANGQPLFVTDGLPDGWGVERFPCKRVSGLDAFNEGNHDYPVNLQLLEAVADPILQVSQPAHPRHADFQACYSGILEDFTGLYKFVYAAQPDLRPRLPISAEGVLTDSFIGSIDSSIPLFWSWGYRWRPKLTGMSDEDVLTVQRNVLRNENDPTFTVAKCATINLQAMAQGASVKSGCLLAWSGTKLTFYLPNSGSAADTKRNDDGSLDDSTVLPDGQDAMRVILNNYNENHPKLIARLAVKAPYIKTSAQRKELILQWENMLIDHFHEAVDKLNARPNSNTEFLFLMARSTQDVVDDAAEVEQSILVIGYVLLIVYACGSLANLTWPLTQQARVLSRAYLAFLGIVIVAISTLAGFGLSAYFGIKFTPISVNLVPLLSLGLGIDDMFVMIHSVVHENKFQHAPSERMTRALALSGPSVVLTSLCNFLAFFIASFTPVPAVESFSQQMAIAVLTNLAFLMLMFVPIMAADSYRVAASKQYLWSKPLDVSVDEAGDHSKGASLMERFVENHYGPFLSHRAVKMGVLLVFGTFFGLTVWLALDKTEQGLKTSDIALRGTYQRDFSEALEAKFSVFDSFVVTRGIDMPQRQADVLAAVRSAQRSTWVSQSTPINSLGWLSASSSSLLSVTGGSTNAETPLPPAAFYPAFFSWISTIGVLYADDLVCANVETDEEVPCNVAAPTTRIVASRMVMYVEKQSSHDNVISSINDIRDRLDAVPSADSFAFGYTFKYYEQYLHIEENLYKIAGLSLVGVVVANTILQFSLTNAVIVAVLILMIDFELYGCMYLLGVKLNAFSMVNLIISIGMAVEFTAHFAHGFLSITGTRNERMVAALKELMAPMTSGMVSSMLAVVMLATARFPFFRAYYFAMFVVMMVIAFLNGLMLLPVVLSLIGPDAHRFGGRSDKDMLSPRARTSILKIEEEEGYEQPDADDESNPLKGSTSDV